MTLTIDNSSNLKGSGNSGTPSQKSANNSEQSPRSNPVCLEASVAIRSLPGEMSGLSQPVREDARTVIVFDNGAVIRSTSNLPIGQKVILSNSAGRDVVCRVADGRNMPNIKGYVEVEFLEPVNDFWNIHQSGASAAVAAPSAALPPHAESAAPPAPPVPAVTRAADRPEIVAKPTSKPAGSASSAGNRPSYDDIPGLMSMPVSAKASEPKAVPELPGVDVKTKNVSDSAVPASSGRPAAANRPRAIPEPQADAHETSPDKEILSINSPAPAATRDFMGKGLMAFEKAAPSAATNGRKPLIIGVAAIVLAGACAVVYFTQRDTTPEPTMNMSALTHPVNPVSSAAPSTPSSESPRPNDTAPAVAQPQAQPEPVSVEPAPPATPAMVPAVVTNAATSDSGTDTRSSAQNLRRSDKNAGAAIPADLAASRRPVIPSLKMNSPSAPNKNVAISSGGAAAMTEISAPEAVGGTPSAGLLTSAGRTSNPPAAPASAPAPAATAPVAKAIRNAKLISSTRPEYPSAAKQSRVQGDVSVLLDVDATGKVTGAKALTGPPLLRQAAVESVRQWKYAPGATDGIPTPSEVTVNIAFRLN